MKRRPTLSRLDFMKTSTATLAIVFTLGIGVARAQSPNPDILAIERETGKVVATYASEGLRKEFVLQGRTTATPWSKGGQTTSFRGPLLKDILAKNGIAGAKEFEILAYNDFVSSISDSEIDAYSPILAIEQQCVEEDRTDGLCAAGQSYRPLSDDDGGPFYLIWPLKDLPPSYIPGRNSIWVWFVVAIRPAQ